MASRETKFAALPQSARLHAALAQVHSPLEHSYPTALFWDGPQASSPRQILSWHSPPTGSWLLPAQHSAPSPAAGAARGPAWLSPPSPQLSSPGFVDTFLQMFSLCLQKKLSSRRQKAASASCCVEVVTRNVKYSLPELSAICFQV